MNLRNPNLDGNTQLISNARSLIQKVVSDTDATYGFGTLTCTVYDTARVALVTKPLKGERQWLFPESFRYILSTQADDGSWPSCSGSQIDGVLSTAAALLALLRHRRQPLQLLGDTDDLDSRITRAIATLRDRLAAWDVMTINYVGFEMIVPAILDLLEKEDASLAFEFDGKATLLDIHKAKMSRFEPSLVYDKRLMTVTHSLEALIGKIDFDRLVHHKVLGSMFASPSSTAAYLMNTSTWDDEAEAYLRYAIKGSVGQGSGGVPGVFPTTNFEYTWTLVGPVHLAPSRQAAHSGTYAMIIPFTWTSCNNRTRTYAAASLLYEMMVLSFRTYHIDDFMESVARPAFKYHIEGLRHLVGTVTAKASSQSDGVGYCTDVNGDHMEHSKYGDHIHTLTRCVRSILENPVFQSASPNDRKTLEQELRVYLLAHAKQVEDNSQFEIELKQTKTLTSASSAYFRWVYTTSADHIAAPMCFAFLACVIGATLTPSTNNDCFPSTTSKYLAAAACRHLAVMCRMYNDIGSWVRDLDEGNLNSIHFPEFSGTDDGTKQAVLFNLAQYERKCLNDALERLIKEMLNGPDAEAIRLSERRMHLVRMFCDVTDLYGQIYVLQDMSSFIRRRSL
ncbi:hypothetical protein BO94DRAFT_615056 [Aspergillus sclerotioniger CBS 115572]|uniref:Uncharacterized protein n=1 Tax=Aspergillus sclerotioniger CBS 115572 TaxID=1450535 RepID=A0A317X7M7_9EURO|nr:hypothetical protein BO94DRAFT_615056 [Aspergillus sclerotioniger CBS 115572]PWY93642.1 hypothetical protein BO94DRAFT_615056 [Aspergillus sclerotioniger CBS 115572]